MNDYDTIVVQTLVCRYPLIPVQPVSYASAGLTARSMPSVALNSALRHEAKLPMHVGQVLMSLHGQRDDHNQVGQRRVWGSRLW